MYDNLEYAQKRLSKTVVRHKDGRVFFITGVVMLEEEKGLFCQGYLINLNKGHEDAIVNLKDIDLTPVPLGYLNFSKKGLKSVCAWSCRIPIRQCWRQGLLGTNFYGVNHDGSIIDFPPLEVLTRTIHNKYPTYKQALEAIKNKEAISIAFSRNFALDKDELFYKGKWVGDRDLSLKGNFFYLKGYLDEVMKYEDFR